MANVAFNVGRWAWPVNASETFSVGRWAWPAALSVTIELAWTASASADVDHYPIYHNSGSGAIDLTAGPAATPAASPWSTTVTGTGRHLFLVRAADADGNEEANLSQMASVYVSCGTSALRPNEPVVLNGAAIAAGQARLNVLYDRTDEAGVATSIEVYANDGAGGAIDYDTAVGTAVLGTGTIVQSVTVDTTGLSGGLTYRLGARARTDAGDEDTNTDYVEVLTDSTAPSAPALTASVV